MYLFPFVCDSLFIESLFTAEVRAAVGRFFEAAVVERPLRGHSSDDDGPRWGSPPPELRLLRAYFAEDWRRVDAAVAELGFRTVASLLSSAAPTASAAAP